MKNVIGALAVVAGLAMSVRAQSRLELQVSLDGAHWSSQVGLALDSGAHRTVLTRALISYTGTLPAVAFAALTWQPTFSNIRPGVDSVNPFADRGNNTNGGGVVLDSTPMDGPFGRIQPFAATGPAVTSTLRYAPIPHSGGSGGAPPGNYFRIARNDITRWMGTGPTSGTAAVNNFNGAGGVACVQKFGTADPAFEQGITDKVIWQISLNVGGVGPGAFLVIDVIAPTEGMTRNRTTGFREASWFSSLGDNSGSTKGTVTVIPASITVNVPAPGTLAAAAFGALLFGRRRR